MIAKSHNSCASFSFLSFCCFSFILFSLSLSTETKRKTRSLPSDKPKVRLIAVYWRFSIWILLLTPTTHFHIVLFSFAFACMPSYPSGEHFGSFVESSRPVLRSKGAFDCCFLQFSFSHFLAQKTSGTHIKTPFSLPFFFPSSNRH